MPLRDILLFFWYEAKLKLSSCSSKSFYIIVCEEKYSSAAHSSDETDRRIAGLFIKFCWNSSKEKGRDVNFVTEWHKLSYFANYSLLVCILTDPEFTLKVLSRAVDEKEACLNLRSPSYYPSSSNHLFPSVRVGRETNPQTVLCLQAIAFLFFYFSKSNWPHDLFYDNS